ncbi:hypothetical protein GW17_00047375 [Ensete ventricosum]|nr:hypothetical protein GW17_00047375 [Ensete ventricosum]
MEGLKVKVPKEVVAAYIKSTGFEMGLVRPGQVSYEYGYQVALAQFQTRYPKLKIEEDPFKILPEDSIDIVVCPSWVDPPESGAIGAVFTAVSIGELIIGGVADCMSCGMCRTIVCIIPSSAWTWWVRPRKALAVIAGGPRFIVRGGNPELLNSLQLQFGVPT